MNKSLAPIIWDINQANNPCVDRVLTSQTDLFDPFKENKSPLARRAFLLMSLTGNEENDIPKDEPDGIRIHDLLIRRQKPSRIGDFINQWL